METKTYSLQLDTVSANHPDIQAASAVLRQGGLVAFPTETVYGLGADATNRAAIQRIFAVKGRPADNPLIVHVAHKDQVLEIVDESELDPLVWILMERFWPGPLTLVLPVKQGILAEEVTAGLRTVAVRIPDHSVALSMIEAAGIPIAAPSANRSGRPSPTLAAHVVEDLSGKIDVIVDGGPTGVGLESTVAAVRGNEIDVLRPGGITAAQLSETGAAVNLDSMLIETSDEKHGSLSPRSPGVKYIHYAPRAPMTLVKGSEIANVHAHLQAAIDEAAHRGERTGIITYAEHASRYRADVVLHCGERNHPERTARTLYAALREMDQREVTCIFSDLNFFISQEERRHLHDDDGLLVAIENRLLKAAGNRVLNI